MGCWVGSRCAAVCPQLVAFRPGDAVDWWVHSLRSCCRARLPSCLPSRDALIQRVVCRVQLCVSMGGYAPTAGILSVRLRTLSMSTRVSVSGHGFAWFHIEPEWRLSQRQLFSPVGSSSRRVVHYPPLALQGPGSSGLCSSDSAVGMGIPVCCSGTVRVQQLYMGRGIAPSDREYRAMPFFRTQSVNRNRL